MSVTARLQWGAFGLRESSKAIALDTVVRHAHFASQHRHEHTGVAWTVPGFSQRMYHVPGFHRTVESVGLSNETNLLFVN